MLARVAERHGDDFFVLDQLTEPETIDRAKVCAMAIEVYSEVLSLPTEQVGPALRGLHTK